MRSIPPGPIPKKKTLSCASMLSKMPLVKRPPAKRAKAPSDINPSITLIADKGIFKTLNETMADSPPNTKAIEDTAPWIAGKFFVKTPAPMAPMAIKETSTVKALKLTLRGRKHAPMIDNSPKRKMEELKIIEEGPTPRSLT